MMKKSYYWKIKIFKKKRVILLKITLFNSIKKNINEK